MSLDRFPNFDLDKFLGDCDVQFKVHDAVDHIEYAMNCPMCHRRGEPSEDTHKKLWLNLKEGAFICYRCDWSGSTIRLVQTLAKSSFEDAVKLLKGKALDPLQHLNLRLVIDEPDPHDDDEHLLVDVELPYGFNPIESPHPYLEKRGIPWQYAAKHDWGVSDAGFTKDRIIVPTFMNGRLVFWQARATWDEPENKDFKKVLNPKGVSNRPILYNYDSAKEFETIIITEGFMDCAKVGADAVATNGKRLHGQQVEWLTKTKAKTIVMLWDRDAWTDARVRRGKKTPPSVVQAADLLKAAGFKVKGVKLPDEKDPGSYQYKSKKLRALIDSAIPL
jgi:DNA primase